VRGVLIVRELPGTSHGARSNRLAYRMTQLVERHGLGRVFAQDTGFKIERDPDTVRAPDVGFVPRERLALIPEEGYADVAPDLVAEILSPGDRPGEVLEKVGQWLSAGVRLVWVLDPARRDARIYRADGTVSCGRRWRARRRGRPAWLSVSALRHLLANYPDPGSSRTQMFRNRTGFRWS
jgi:Uma2 family endonuclease